MQTPRLLSSRTDEYRECVVNSVLKITVRCLTCVGTKVAATTCRVCFFKAGDLEVNNPTVSLYRKPTLNWRFDMPGKTSKSHRELIDTGRDKRYVRRDEKGQFDEVSDVGRSLSQDRKRSAKTKVPKGQGDRGDQKRK